MLITTSIMPYGQYMGRQMKEIPIEYFVWSYVNNRLRADVADYIKEYHNWITKMYPNVVLSFGGDRPNVNGSGEWNKQQFKADYQRMERLVLKNKITFDEAFDFLFAKKPV